MTGEKAYNILDPGFLSSAILSLSLLLPVFEYAPKKSIYTECDRK
jgi:hypothetical protein